MVSDFNDTFAGSSVASRPRSFYPPQQGFPVFRTGKGSSILRQRLDIMDRIQLERLTRIEDEVIAAILDGLNKGQRKKFLVEEVGHDLFLKHMGRDDGMPGEEFRLALHILRGTVQAILVAGAKPEKGLKHAVRGLVHAIVERGGYFYAAAATVMRAATLCAHELNQDVLTLVGRALEGVVETTREKHLNPMETVKLVARTTLDAADSADAKEVAGLEQIFLQSLSIISNETSNLPLAAGNSLGKTLQ